MTVEPEWAVDLEDNYNAATLRAPWGQRINDSMLSLGGAWTAYQPVVSGGITPDDNGRYQGRWKRFGDVAIVEQNWSVTSADTISADAGDTIFTTLPFEVRAVGIERLSGAGFAEDSAGSSRRDVFDCRLTTANKIEFHATTYNADDPLDGPDVGTGTTLPVSVSMQMWVLLKSTVSATGGTYDNDLAATYTPGAGAPSEAYHSKINVNMALPGTFTESTAQFVNADTSPSPTALTVTAPVRRSARLGELGFFQFEFTGPVTGTGTGGETWLIDLPSGWTMADSGVQWLGWVYADTDRGSTKYPIGVAAYDFETDGTGGTTIAVYATLKSTSTSTCYLERVRDDAAGQWNNSATVVRSGLLVCRLT